MSNIINIPSLNPVEFANKGRKTYEKIKASLEESHKDEFVAIEPDSEEYYLGKEQMEAIKKAKEKHPNKIFYLVKIGHEAVNTMSSHFKPVNYGSLL